MKKIGFVIFFIMALFNSNYSVAQDCPDTCAYFITNTLTPDCDQADCEMLEIPSNCPFEIFEFTLYNRWGEILFQSNDQGLKFDSTGQEDGVYVWTLKGQFCNSKQIDDKGYITILR